MELYCEKNRKSGEYRNFYKNKVAVSMCGAEREDIVKVKIQEIETENPTHWGYFDIEDKVYHFIFKTKTAVQMCSPDFFKRDIAEGKGRIVKIQVEELI
ncbi:hypothetical protein CVD28_03385 [Bacillus sp. M6-12]|uniref:hypothetical protein n=1 Tax=Bacillus sp. M6-12 TaxID=2054166 RepID=UPI000C77074C|nr:hypothetical protein [Bacillus sp. M6-12]PLS19472.1 hypothetical protein CVD28_03385 [Bacillus sp. M6-12]